MARLDEFIEAFHPHDGDGLDAAGIQPTVRDVGLPSNTLIP
jgi:hypothetical protein